MFFAVSLSRGKEYREQGLDSEHSLPSPGAVFWEAGWVPPLGSQSQECFNSSLHFCLSVPPLNPFLGAVGRSLRKIRTE